MTVDNENHREGDSEGYSHLNLCQRCSRRVSTGETREKPEGFEQSIFQCALQRDKIWLGTRSKWVAAAEVEELQRDNYCCEDLRQKRWMILRRARNF